MRFSLNIDYPLEKIEASRKRMEARESYRCVDRVPVGFCFAPRYFTPIFDMPYSALFTSAEDQYHWHLQFLKYRIENVPEDMVCTSTTLCVAPYFDNVVDSASFGAEVVWPENETLQARPTIHTVEQMERFEVPAPGTGLWGKLRDWWLQMREFAQETRLTFNGEVEGRIDVGTLGLSWLSPHMIAIDLVGPDFFWWPMEYPEQCHVFLGKITDGLIEALRHFMTVDDRPRSEFCVAEDNAQSMSAEMFRDICVPYTKKLYDTFGPGLRNGRAMHMCGDSAHLHKVLVDELQITGFELFGCNVDPETVAENMGGRAYLWGNIDPMLMLNGSKEEVKQAARRALEALAPCGGYLLGDGANVCPGTSLENLAALVEASEEYGAPGIGERLVTASPSRCLP
ncbi:MAG: hypothetical protein HQ559_14340 [Lentisphaerae bacterium]|nr:hypothetical protein [Lentisphaerota bacterium]